ncbi:MAG TPA: hypothetical protein VHT53_02975 [Candidatus Elarobacter sp.]|nr:hypothetical protein [Candidatus Elarobacter sp.]
MPPSVLLPPYEPRRVIVHQHIMKCAGSTIIAILERVFGNDLYHVHRDSPRGVIYPEQLAAYIEATPDVRAITTHHLRSGPTEGPFEVVDCAPLRDPIDRIASLYRFTSGDPSQMVHPLTVRGMEAFVHSVLEQFPDVLMNVQTAVLVTRAASRPAGPIDLERAIERTRRSSFLVIADRFDESMVVAEYFLCRSSPELRLHYRAENVTRPLETPLDERRREIRAEVGESTYALLQRISELDEALLTAARAELDRRIALVPGFALRLQAFRRRCATFAEAQPA